MAVRKLLRAIDASNEGVRRLREVLRSRSAAVVARLVGCDATAIRRWAREERTPTAEWRTVLHSELGIAESAWEEPVGAEPPTERR